MDEQRANMGETARQEVAESWRRIKELDESIAKEIQAEKDAQRRTIRLQALREVKAWVEVLGLKYAIFGRPGTETDKAISEIVAKVDEMIKEISPKVTLTEVDHKGGYACEYEKESPLPPARIKPPNNIKPKSTR